MAKIKITKTPGANIRPLWQQDKSTYSLDTRKTMPNQEKEENEVRTQFPEVDEKDATIEAERGERILTPDMENFAIGGKKHSQGGTFLDAEPGSFIFSDDKSMRIKGDILKEFGINPDTKTAKKGFTPADIAKKYPTNKLFEKLRDKNSDKLDKDTAMLNMEGMKSKLGKLAFIQESMKGFPKGVPDFSEEGVQLGEDDGMETAQQGTMVGSGAGQSFSPFGQPTQGVYYWGPRRRKSETKEQYLERKKKFYYDKKVVNYRNPVAPPGGWLVNANVNTPNQSLEDPGTVTITGGGGAKAKIPGITPAGPMDPKHVDLRNAPFSTTRDLSTPTGLSAKGDGSGTFVDPIYDTGYGTMDYVNMAAPFMTGLRKFNPRRINVQPQSLDFNPLDLEAQRQAIKGQVAQAQTANSVFSGSAGQASARNSQLMGTALDPLNQSFMSEFNANQAGRMQVEGQNAQFRQQADQLNAGFDDQYQVRQDLVNENFMNEKRLRLQQFLKVWNGAERNKQIRNAGNVINQDFMVTAEGKVVRKMSSYNPARQFARITGDGGGPSGMSFEDYKAALPQDVLSSATPWQIYNSYLQQNSANYSGKDVQGVNVSSRNPYMIPQPYDYSTYPGE